MNSSHPPVSPLIADSGLAHTAFTAAHKPLSMRGSRLRKHADYQAAYKGSRKQFSPSMAWFLAERSAAPARPAFLPAVPPGPRVGLTVPKVLGKAHDRNRIKRRMREVVRRHLDALPEGIDLILHPKKTVLMADFVKLEAEVLRIFRQAAAQTMQARRSRAGTLPTEAIPKQATKSGTQPPSEQA